MLKRYCILLVLLQIMFYTCAQDYEQTFGKNRVQNKTYDWKVLSFRNTDVYYYGQNKELAEYAGRFSEENLLELTNITGFTPYSKIRLIIYANMDAYHQANIAISDPEYISGGQTTFIKTRVEVPFKGTTQQFEKDIQQGIANTLVYSMLYGGSFKEVLQNTYFLSLPDWFISGATRYIAYGWDLDMDNYVRSLLSEDKLDDPHHLKGDKAAIVGQSIWNYFVFQFGESEFQAILNFVKVVKNYKVAFESGTGVPYDTFLSNWQDFYTGGYQLEKDPKSKGILEIRNGSVTSFCLLDKDKLAVTTISNNRFHLRAKDLSSSASRTKTLYKGGQRVLNRKENSILPIVRSDHNQQPALLISKPGKGYFFHIYNSDSRKWEKIKIPGLNNITDYTFSPDGKSILLAGSNSVNSDLYQFSLQTRKLYQLTNFVHDEINPRYIPFTNKITYSSNSYSDTITGNTYFQVHVMDLRTRKVELTMPIGGNSDYPKVTKDGIFFVNDLSGYASINYYSFRDSSITLMYRSDNGIQDFELVDDGQTFIIQSLDGGKITLKQVSTDSLLAETETGILLTRRANYIDQMRNDKAAEMRARKRFSRSPESPDSENTEEDTEEELIDIQNYRFESEKQSDFPVPDIELIREKLGADVYLKGPEAYTNPFSLQNVNSTILIDPLRGLGILLNADMSDLLENHKLSIGIFGLMDLQSSNMFGSYRFLRHRTDLGIGYERKTIFASSGAYSEKYALNTAEFSISYPLDVSKRLDFSPFVAVTTYTPLDLSLQKPDTIRYNVFYTGARKSFVMDNTISYGPNVRSGFRGAVHLDSYLSPQPQYNFGKLVIDLRHYLPLYKKLTFATRAYYGQFFGKSPKKFLLGGMNNWLFNNTVRQGQNNPLAIEPFVNNSDLLFVEYVMPMRGFSYNQQFGDKAFVFNAELRLPVAGIIFPEEVNSTFIRNFEIAGFTDIGAAWSGKSPYSKENILNTNTIDNSNTPFNAQVNTYKNPYLIGYGLGLRTILLGYFVKLDIAWGWHDRQAHNTRYYVTLGYDF